MIGPRARRKIALTPYLFLLPGLALFLVFRLYPLLDGLRLSFTNARLGRAQYAFVGLGNYQRLLEDTRFHVSLVNTAFYAVASTLPILAIPLVLAIALDRGVALRTFLRGAFFFPFTLSVVTVGLAWLWLLDPVVGPLNYYLKALGLPARSWLADPSTAMWAIIMTSVWWVTGYYLVIYLAGLQDIPRELYEAAALDGAGNWTAFRSITLPLLRPVLLVAVVLRTIDAVGTFDQVYVLTKGGPGTATQLISIYAYNTAFLFNQYGRAMAMLISLLVCLLLLMAAAVHFMRRSAEIAE